MVRRLGLGLGLTTIQGTGGGASTPNQILLNAAKAYPKIGVLGASRQRQNAAIASNENRTLPTSETTWAQALDRRFSFQYWYDNSANQNSANMLGSIFANDGDGFNQQWNRLPKIVASDIQVIIYELPTDGIQINNYDIYGTNLGTSLSVDGYCDRAKQIINYLIDNGVAVIIRSLWERNVSTGGVWASGQAPRLLVPSIDAAMSAWGVTNGIPFIDERAVLIDTGTSDNNPISAYVRDGTHFSPIGGYVGGKTQRDLLATVFNAAPASAVETGNKTTNPSLSGTGGSGLTGTIATSLTGSRTIASTATVTAAIITDGNGERWQECQIDTSTMTPSTIEGINFAVALNAVVSGDWYESRCKVQVDAWDGWKGVPNLAFDVGTRNVTVLPPVDSGGSVPFPVNMNVMQGPTEAYAIEPVSGQLLSDTTSATFGLDVYFTAGTGIGKFRFTQPQLYPVADPRTLMYDESSVLTPSITSSASISIPEEANYTHTLTANMPGRWSISGTDAALIGTPDQHGRLVISSKDYELPTDANTDNVYTATITFTPFDTRRSAVTQTLNVTVTDVNDGFTDLFNGTAGLDLSVYSANWTLVGVALGIVIHTNGAEAVNDSTKLTAAYLSPQQGNTDEQRVSAKIQSGSGKMHRAIRLLDQDNALFFTEESNNVVVKRRNAGSVTTVGTFTPYKTLANNDVIGAQVLNDNLEVWQNDVPLVLASGTRVISGALFHDGVVRSGLLSSNTASAFGRIYDYNNRVAATHADKVGLKALSMTPLTGTAGTNYVGALSSRTVGSTISVSVTKSAVVQTDWLADGDFIRCPAVTAGTYTVTVTENFPGAVNDGRQTVFTVVIT